MALESTDVGEEVRHPHWGRVAAHLQPADELLPRFGRLWHGDAADKEFLYAHTTLVGIDGKPRTREFTDLSPNTQALFHIYRATRKALQIAIESFGSSAYDTGRNPYAGVPIEHPVELGRLLTEELKLVHRFSTLLGLADPAGQLMEIHEIARRRCQLPGTDPVLRHVNALASGFKLDFDVDDPWVTRIRRSPRDDRATAEDLERMQRNKFWPRPL